MLNPPELKLQVWSHRDQH